MATTSIVYLHSSGLGPRQWSATRARFGGTSPALLGYHRPWPLRACFDWTDELPALLDLVGPETHLVGHSYGGFLALQIARSVPVRSLALWEPVALSVLPTVPPDARSLADERVDLARWIPDFLGFWQMDWRTMSPSQRAPFSKHGEKVRAEVGALLRDRTTLAAYAAISTPTLLVSGTQTIAPATEICARLAKALPHGRHIAVPDCGHMGPLTQRDAWHTLLEDFWRGR